MKNLQINDYLNLWELAKRYLERGRYFNIAHARISLDFAIRLMDELGGKGEIIIPAIILHDIGDAMIKDKNLAEKTINPGNIAAEEKFSLALKELHLQESAALALKILKEINYPNSLIDPIVKIVGDHEDSRGLPPSDRSDLNKIIVSDADKLYRFTADAIFVMCKVHKIEVIEMLKLAFDNIDKWLITDIAKKIAKEELRKVPGSQELLILMDF